MVEHGKPLERLVERLLHAERRAVAHLRAVHEKELTPGLKHASELSRGVAPRLLGHLVEEIHVGHRVESAILERHRLAVRLGESKIPRRGVLLPVREPLVRLAHRLEIMRREFQRGAVEFRPVIAQKREEATGSRRDVQNFRLPRVAAAHPLGHVRQHLTTHGVRAAQEQSLHLEIVQARAVRGEPTVRLVVEVLEVVRGIPLRIGGEDVEELLPALGVSAVRHGLLVPQSVARDGEDVHGVPLLRGRGGGVEIVRELVHAVLEVFELLAEQIDDGGEVLGEELRHLGRLVFGELAAVGGVANDVAEVGLGVGDLRAGVGVEDSLGDGGGGGGTVDVA